MEGNLKCPKCGKIVSKEDKICSNCGANLQPSWTEKYVFQAEVSNEEAYVRKHSLLGRLVGLLSSPSRTMEDIALAPDYSGGVLIVVLELVVTSIFLMVAMQKIHIVGANFTAWSFVIGIMLVALVISGFFLVALWLVEALLVKAFCNKTSAWSYRSAASVAGYARFADLVFLIIGVIVASFIIPSFTLDVSNAEVARQNIADWSAQTSWIKLWWTLPFSLIGIIWKSYLGGLGVKFGTRGKCSLIMGFAVFLVLGLIGFLLSWVLI